MKLKANLHMHTNDDPRDPVSYSLFEAVDHAAQLGFEVLALTCHGVCAWSEEYARYASAHGILLLSGIELDVGERAGDRGRHVLLLGADADAEHIKTFADLAAYKAKHPGAIVIAPHPYFYGHFSLHEYLEKYIDLFDAIEHSWFYSRLVNRNRKALAIARRFSKPIIATSDTHFFDWMHDNYAILDVPEKTSEAVLEAVKRGSFENYTNPRRFITEMIIPQAAFSLRTVLMRVRFFPVARQ